jgi:hypothetical protein
MDQRKSRNRDSIKSVLANMVSCKTSIMSDFVKYLEYKKLHESDLFKYAQINSSRKWELTASIAKQQVYDKLHLVFKDCILGYGNYSQPGSSKIRTKSKYSCIKMALTALFCI